MKHKILSLLLCCFAHFAQAQAPVYNWTNNYSGSVVGADYTTVGDVATDATGNIYTVGYFYGNVDFDPGPATRKLSATVMNGYMTKTSPAGNLMWVKQFNCTEDVIRLNIAIDKTDGIYIAGLYFGTLDCDPGPATSYLTSIYRNNFILKLDTAGNLKWTKAINNSTGDMYRAELILDQSGNLLLTGSFSGGTPDMDPGPAVATVGGTCSETQYYVLKLDHDGNYLWAKNVGEKCSNIAPYDIAVDSRNSIYLAGTYLGDKDFDHGTGTYTLPSSGSYDLFISKLDSNGNFIKAIKAGSSDIEEARGIAIDRADNIYITGKYTYKTDFDPGTDTLFLYPNSWAWNSFVAKYDTSLAVKWAKNFANPPLSTSGSGYGLRLTCDEDCNVNIIGLFGGKLDFDPGPDTAFMNSSTGSVFISRLDSAGNYIWAGQLNGLRIINSAGIYADQFDNLYTFGDFSDKTDFDPSAGFDNRTPLFTDGFLQKLGICYPYDTTDISACRSYKLEGITYTKSGTYTQMIKTDRKCDVSLTLNLEIQTINDTIVNSGPLLTAKGTGTSYQWVNCPLYSPIPGATNPVYTATSDGAYALIIANGTCSDTSDCITISGTNIRETFINSEITIQPNPASDKTFLFFTKPTQNVMIELLSITGTLLYSNKDFSGDILPIDLHNYSAGIYILKIKEEHKSITIKRIIKQ